MTRLDAGYKEWLIALDKVVTLRRAVADVEKELTQQELKEARLKFFFRKG